MSNSTEIVRDLPRAHRCLENVWIPMSDGTRLAARVWIPEGAEAAPVPAILEYVPYRKRDFTRERDSFMHPYIAGHGYACVRADLRGSGESDGVLTDEYTEQELADGVEILAWMAEQSWCDGNLGIIGISWGGFNGLQIAALRPPGLKAVVTACSTDDRYADDIHHMGGCLLGDNLSWASVMLSYNALPPDPELVGERWREQWMERLEGSGLWLDTWLKHQRRDEYWKHGSICEDWGAIGCPVLAVGGWADGYSNSVFRLLANLDVPRRGLIGPWGHKYPHMGAPGPAIDFLGEVLRWWDTWLKGEDRGIDADPMLRVWMQESVPPTSSYDHRPGRWVAEQSWPSPRVSNRTWALVPGALVEPSANAPEEQMTIRSPLFVGLFAGKWCSYAAGPDLAHDQRQEDGGALVFDSKPLDETIEMLGAAELHVDLAADRPLAMVAVRLSDVAPDDKATRVTYGLLNLTHRDSSEHPEPLEPGRRYRVVVKLNDVAQRFPAGHRLRLSLSTVYWPLAWPSPEPVRLTVSGGSSFLCLPVRPETESDADLRPFGPPRTAPPERPTKLEPGHHNWLVHRDLASDVSTLEVINDLGRSRIEAIGLEVTREAREWYSSRADDFTSPRGETLHTRVLRRGDWSVRVVTRTVLTCSPTEFHLRADIDAYEGEKRIFCRSWDRSVPRDLV